MEYAPFKKIKEINDALSELWENNQIDNTKLYFKPEIKAAEEINAAGEIVIINTQINSYQIGVEDRILWHLNPKFKSSSLEKLIEKWKKKKFKRRLITDKRIFECYDQFGERLTVISFVRNTKERIMVDRNLNAFRALREFSMRNTWKTFSMLCLDMPSDINKFEDALKYQVSITDFNFGLMKPKKSIVSTPEEKTEKIDDGSEENTEAINIELSGSTDTKIEENPIQ